MHRFRSFDAFEPDKVHKVPILAQLVIVGIKAAETSWGYVGIFLELKIRGGTSASKELKLREGQHRYRIVCRGRGGNLSGIIKWKPW